MKFIHAQFLVKVGKKTLKQSKIWGLRVQIIVQPKLMGPN
jgi:hypothetical protein